MRFIEEDRNVIVALLVACSFLFILLLLSPFISFSPIQYVTKAEKAMIYANTAMSDIGKGDLASAERNLRKAILFDAKSVSYQENLGMVLLGQQDKINEALDVFNDILADDPKNLASLYYLGSYSQGKSDYEEAKKKFQAYLDVNPQNPEVFTLLGVVYYRSGNKEGAKDLWRKALAIDPGFEAANDNLAMME